MQKQFSRVVVLLGCAFMLAACGLKGPLYRPDEAAQASPNDEDKLRRPRPAPQAQKEPLPAPTEQVPPVTPVEPDEPTANGIESMPADETR